MMKRKPHSNFMKKDTLFFLLLTLTLSPMVIFILFVNSGLTLKINLFKTSSSFTHTFNLEANGQKAEKYHVQTPFCSIPVTDILPDYYKNLYFDTPKLFSLDLGLLSQPVEKRKRQNIPDCSDEVKLAHVIQLGNNTKILKLDPETTQGKICTLSEITRVDLHDNEYNSIDHGIIENEMDISEIELFIIKCGELWNYDANIFIKPAVRKKIEFWRKKEETKKNPKTNPSKWKNTSKIEPINILILGFDSTSRSHFYRSLPKSAKRLKHLNFTDFRGFHSLHVHTLDNIEGVLLGEHGGACRKNQTYFDNCPFIWDELHRRNYITMYNEDYTQSFNFPMGMGGFKFKQPTDFYLHPLYNAHKHNRNPQEIPEEKLHCVSTESVPQFALRYLQNFLQVFDFSPPALALAPFFSMTFFANPFHDNPQSLADFDDDFEKFLNASFTPQILEKTLVVIFSDHGERHGHFLTRTLESYLERSLPALFIRIPEKLKELHPEIDFQRNFQLNTRRLTSALDIHQTILHTLFLSTKNPRVEKGRKNPNSPMGRFKVGVNSPTLSKSSLFVPVPLNRTCDTLTVPKTSQCVCNSAPLKEVTSIDNPFFVMELIRNATKELNWVVQSSEKWRGKCHFWQDGGLSPLMKISSHLLNPHPNQNPNNNNRTKKEHESEILLRFKAETDFYLPAQFEVKLRLRKGKGKGVERISDFTRIDSYGSQSDCVQVNHPDDQKMKGVCVCKKKR